MQMVKRRTADGWLEGGGVTVLSRTVADQALKWGWLLPGGMQWLECYAGLGRMLHAGRFSVRAKPMHEEQ